MVVLMLVIHRRVVLRWRTEVGDTGGAQRWGIEVGDRSGSRDWVPDERPERSLKKIDVES